jgi:hypothetical protein
VLAVYGGLEGRPIFRYEVTNFGSIPYDPMRRGIACVSGTGITFIGNEASA